MNLEKKLQTVNSIIKTTLLSSANESTAGADASVESWNEAIIVINLHAGKNVGNDRTWLKFKVYN